LKPQLETRRGTLFGRGLSVSSVNQKLSAVRLLLRQATERGVLPHQEAIRLASVANLVPACQPGPDSCGEKPCGND
jgi:hypothetical protein